MADAKVKISALTLGTPLNTDIIPYVDLVTNTTKKALKSDLMGATGNGIASVVLLSTVGLVKTYRITYTNATTFDFTTTDGTNGTNGTNGRGITSILRTSGTGAAGTTDIYTITYTDETTSTFNVYNGANGTGIGDMLLESAQTNTGAKTFLDSTLLFRNVANTISSYFTNAATLARTWTLPDKNGTVAMTSDITGINSGTNTGDQASIVGITGTKAQFNTAVTDGDIMFLDSADTVTGVKTFSVAPVLNALPTGTAVTSNATASTLVSRDASANIAFNNWVGGYTTTATAAATTTLTVGSSNMQYFTGVTTQNVTLPVTTTLTVGHQFEIANRSTGAVTINSSGLNAIVVVSTNQTAIVTCILASGTTAASWDYKVVAQTVGGGASGFGEAALQDYLGTASIGPLGVYQATRAGTLAEVTIVSESIPVGSNLIVELRKNSYTTGNVLSTVLQITTTDTLTNGQKVVSITGFTSATIADGDYFVATLTSVGSTTAALNAKVVLRYT